MKKLCLIGVLIVSALGTLFHFAYDYVPLFIFPLNESIFEHTKLTIFPYLFYLIFALIFIKEERMRLFSSFFTAIIVSTVFIVVFYYTYSGILGFGVDWLNILSYYVSILIGFIIIYKKMTLASFSNSVIFLIILLILVGVFTYFPANIAFFKNPIH